MSDADTVRFYLDKRDDLAGWLALDRLESQNQALQERIETALDVVTGFYGLAAQHTDADRLRIIGELLIPDPGD